MARFFLLASALVASASGTHLPSFVVHEHRSVAELGGKWWTQVDERVYHSPAPLSGLSENIENYYYALGSEAALSDELKNHRVGGEGRLHIFHLPQGPSMLQLGAQVGGRRSSLSNLNRLEAGMVLSTTFPAYDTHDQDYKNPLDSSGQELEKAAVGQITPDSVMAILGEITKLPSNEVQPTRSAHNIEASVAATQYLKKEFEALGMTVCPLSFNVMGMALTNVVAYVPGSTVDTVTVGAHYDSIPQIGLAPGAEDNGSGVAALLAMAKAFASTKACPTKTVYFVGFAGEEAGLLGSKNFADQLKTWTSEIPDKCKPVSLRQTSFLQAVRAQSAGSKSDHQAIIMDEIGWQSPKLESQTVNLESYDWASEMMDHLKQSSSIHNGDSLTVVHSSNPFGSDHMSFLSHNMPAVLTINGDDEAYPHYHQSTDQIQYVNGTLLSKIAKMNMGALMRSAGVHECASSA